MADTARDLLTPKNATECQASTAQWRVLSTLISPFLESVEDLADELKSRGSVEEASGDSACHHLDQLSPQSLALLDLWRNVVNGRRCVRFGLVVLHLRSLPSL